MTMWLPWRAAGERALFGPDGFYRSPGGPAAHFRTSAHTSGHFAAAILTLLAAVDEALDRPGRLDFVDMGAGRGELSAGVLASARRERPDIAARLAVTAVELAAPPPSLPEGVRWTDRRPDGVVGLAVANEWLDTVPVDVVVGSGAPPGGATRGEGRDGLRMLLVDTVTGRERPGGPPDAEQAAWLARWWPPGPAPDTGAAGGLEKHAGGGARGGGAWSDGYRAEVGLWRDAAWADTIRSVRRGLAVAVDYGHTRAARPTGGTLDAYRGGRRVAPVPDGTCDITWHVAIDACAAAGEAAGVVDTLLTSQRDALGALGLSGRPPGPALARTDPGAYLRALAAAGETAELTDAAGWGGFAWLLQSIGISLPPFLRPDGERTRARTRLSGV